MFKNVSSNSEALKNTFKTDEKLEVQALSFEKTLNNIFHQSFQKVRGRKRKFNNTEIDCLLKERKRIKITLKDSQNRAAQNRLEEVDKLIAILTSEKNSEKIYQMFQNISSSIDSLNTLGMWKQVRKLFPKVLKSVPTGIRNHKGKIVTKYTKLN